MFKIKCINGKKVSVEAELTCKVLDFKELISPKVDVPAAQQRLIYSGKVLKDTETLESYNLKQGRTVYMAPEEPDENDENTPNPAGAIPCTTMCNPMYWSNPISTLGCLCLRIPFM